jgi:hypothetical protein
MPTPQGLSTFRLPPLGSLSTEPGLYLKPIHFHCQSTNHEAYSAYGLSIDVSIPEKED